MPRNVRNFWLEAEIDGQAKKVVGGPKSKDGGFSITIKMRDAGKVTTAMHIEGRVFPDGQLQVEARLDESQYHPGDGMLTAVGKR